MKHYRIEIKWALIFFLVQLVWVSLERLFGFHDKRIDQYLFVSQLLAIPYTYIYYRALKEKRKKVFRGYMSYDQALATGLRLTLFLVFLTPATHYLLIYLISPHYLSHMEAYSIATHQYDAEKASEYFSATGKLIQNLVYSVVIGILTSLVISLFTYRKREIE